MAKRKKGASGEGLEACEGKALPQPSSLQPPLDLTYIAEGLRPLACPIDQLVLDPANARKHGDANMKSIIASLRTFGQRRPAVVNRRNMEIEAGNGMVTAAKQLGWSHVAVLLVDDDPGTQTRFAVADNRTAELAEWDQDRLQGLLGGLAEDGELFDALLLNDLLAIEPPAAESEPEPIDVPPTWQVVVGCKDEQDQKEVFERLREEGRECRMLTL